jgi:hypothetical protein
MLCLYPYFCHSKVPSDTGQIPVRNGLVRLSVLVCWTKCSVISVIVQIHRGSYLSMYSTVKTDLPRYTLTGQKYFRTKIFPYTFHIKPLIFITFSWSHSLQKKGQNKIVTRPRSSPVYSSARLPRKSPEAVPRLLLLDATLSLDNCLLANNGDVSSACLEFFSEKPFPLYGLLLSLSQNSHHYPSPRKWHAIIPITARYRKGDNSVRTKSLPYLQKKGQNKIVTRPRSSPVYSSARLKI